MTTGTATSLLRFLEGFVWGVVSELDQAGCSRTHSHRSPRTASW